MKKKQFAPNTQQLRSALKSHRLEHLHQNTKILCTMGPAIASQNKIIELVLAGANGFRLNMSHGSHDIHLENINIIRSAEKKLGIFLPIVADLQGPKIRVADLKDQVIELVTGDSYAIADRQQLKKSGAAVPKNFIPIEYPEITKDVKKGDILLFDDGLMKVTVTSVKAPYVHVMVMNGGILKSRKGINLPNVKVSQPSMSDKDKKDVKFAVEQGVDYVALSFVRKPEDILHIKKHIAKLGGKQWVIAKIEKPEAVSNIEDIVKVSDVIMVARGDLGVEIPAAEVPTVQKNIIAVCNRYAKPVITATQMLESMINNPRPTRAEASDVANAVLDGTDVVMLSAETSVGTYPVETVSYMRTICSEAESHCKQDDMRIRRRTMGLPRKEHNTDLIATAAATIAENQDVAGISTLSLSGETALLISNRRPNTPIIAMTEFAEIARRTGLFWGVTGVLIDKVGGTDFTVEHMKQFLKKEQFFKSGESVVITIGRPLVARSRTNMLTIEQIP
ncbi:MAG: pyruvate kinase [Ignavibacteria bacterium]